MPSSRQSSTGPGSPEPKVVSTGQRISDEIGRVRAVEAGARSVECMTERSKSEGRAVWYFVAATFLVVASVFMVTMAEGLALVAGAALLAGLVVAVVGVIVFRRELSQRSARPI